MRGSLRVDGFSAGQQSWFRWQIHGLLSTYMGNGPVVKIVDPRELHAAIKTVRQRGFGDDSSEALAMLLREYGEALSTRLGCPAYPATISRNTTRLL